LKKKKKKKKKKKRRRRSLHTATKYFPKNLCNIIPQLVNFFEMYEIEGDLIFSKAVNC
jgi:hypothetical protein